LNALLSLDEVNRQLTYQQILLIKLLTTSNNLFRYKLSVRLNEITTI